MDERSPAQIRKGMARFNLELDKLAADLKKRQDAEANRD